MGLYIFKKQKAAHKASKLKDFRMYVFVLGFLKLSSYSLYSSLPFS